ncbi:MFS transporter [Flaviaesturariibacter flavus]|uniref:MFS transporter n=2 Tax=Flaviaesturariibacter flavus TaxID=2502780 RepID=A0A4V2NVS3_9BACT|nr:MFS transporter [Flaviaesturariibacter flavus]
MQTATQKGHPKGLGVLFATEMWERFNFYGMRAILSLFIAEALLMGEKQASLIYGGFLGLCYLTPMLGGYISDKYLGNRNCIMLGGALMGLGQLMLFFSASTFGSSMSAATTLMWAALGVIVFGNGFFKPNISSMVGQLYPKEQKTKLDSAFTIFYMGINVGAFLGITICPLLGDVKHDGVRDLSAFKWGFLAASAAMFLGTILFAFLKNKYVVTPSGEAIGARPDRNAVYEGESTQAKFTSGAIGMAALIFAALVAFFYFIGGQNIIYSIIYGAGISLAVLIMTDATITKVERQRILVLYIIAFFVIFFWAAFEQAGSSLTFIADKQTDTHILGWEMPPSMIQNFNSFFVIILAIPMSLLWTALASRRAEPISPVKQAIGLALIALGYFIIATQVKGLGTAGKIGIIWMIILYFLHTVGELCLSPIGLSLVAKLAPKRFASLLMGVWFLGNAAGYALTGTLGALLPPTGDKYAEAATKGIDLGAVLDKKVTLTPEQTAFLADKKIPTAYTEFAGFTIHNLYEFFMVFVILCGVAAVVLYALTPLLKRMMHGVR